MRRRPTSRIGGAALLVGALLVGALQGIACEPQDVYLFDRVSVVDAGSGGGGADLPEVPAAADPRMPPDCASDPCEACSADPSSCRPGLEFCHPLTGACALICDPETGDAARRRVCPTSQVCHPEYGLCVDCLTSPQCNEAGSEVCDVARGQCVQCNMGSDCPAERPVCDTATQRCVECTPDQACAIPGEVCQPGTLRCVECVEDAHCLDDEDRLCVELRCVECRTDADCIAVDREKPICSAELECEDAD